MPGVWNPTTGATMGTAMGAIRIDTSDVERAGTVTKTSVKQITDAFNNIKGGASGTKPALVGLANDIGKVRGEIIALSAGAAALTGIGLTTAGNLQVARVQLSGLLGGIQKSTAYTEELRKKAVAAGMPFGEMLKIATTLLPALKGNTDELDRYANIADRLAVLKPEIGAAGAAEALRMAVGSGGEELGRLGRTFGISQQELQAAIKQTSGDLAAALDLVLNKMGATNEAADEMDRTFPETLARTKDAAGQLLATGFTPLLNTLTPILENITQFAMQVQQTNPELLTMGAGMLAIVAAGGPMLLMFSQVISSLQTIKTLSIAGSLGKAAGVGISAALGVGVGIEASRGIGRATGNEQLANASIGDLLKIIKTYVLVIFDAISKAQIEIGMFIGSTVRSAIGQFVTVIGEAAMAIAALVAKIFPAQGAEYVKAAQSLIDFGKGIALTSEQMDALRGSFEKQRTETLQGMMKVLFPEIGASAAASQVGGGTGAPTTAEEFTAEQIDAFADFQADMKEMERQGAEERLRINEQYQDAVTNIEKHLSDMRANIAKAEKDAQDAEAKKEEDYQLKLSDIADSAREADIKAAKDYNTQRERDERAHRENLLDAASRFDVLGIIREMRSYNEKRTNADEDFSAAQEQRADELVQRLQQEADAHTREMDELRENNRDRLNELRQEYSEEYNAAQEKLIKLRDAHVKELSELDQKLARERDVRQRAYIEQFNSLAGSLNNQITIARQGQAQLQADLRAWWTNMRNDMNTILNQTSSQAAAQHGADEGGNRVITSGAGGKNTPGSYAVGGRIPEDMLAYVHKDEEVIPADVARQIRAAMGGAISQPALSFAFSGGGGGGSSIGPISVGPIYGAPGQSVEALGQVVEEKLLNILRAYNKSVKR
jgi:hypothetical protein